jgi:oxaloacetate decarboxylase alpha subunit
MSNPLKITELVFRDAHQSLLATRLRIEDMLPMAPQLDRIGYWSMESWGGATFDSCIRYLGEDPWERLRQIKAAMPNTPQQMLLRGQNLLGYRHYADDVVETFVNRAAANGVDVFRIFDALNDVRNLETAIKATVKAGKHAQGTLSYTVSPVHTVDKYVEIARKLQELGCHSIAIKDMAGLLKPYVAYELVSKLKKACDIPIMMQSHATTGMSTVTNIKAAEAGIDGVDTAISPMSMTYGHSPTESIVAILQDTDRDTGLDLAALDDIAAYFRQVRRKYRQFEGSLRGVDARILLAQVPGGMLTNMEKQLSDQGSLDSFDKVLEEIPRVRKDLGYIPLVTPTSQIVGTQAVLNVLLGERYKSITKETQAILRGEYGETPIPVDKELQQRVLHGEKPVTQRPADLLKPELQKLADELDKLAHEHRFTTNGIDDVLTYALFPQVGLKFLQNRGDASAFEPPPDPDAFAAAKQSPVAAVKSSDGPQSYSVSVNGRSYDVVVSAGGKIENVQPAVAAPAASATTSANAGSAVTAPMAGNIVKVLVKPGQQVAANDIVIVLEAMKMETEVRAPAAGTVAGVEVKEGDTVELGSTLLTLS